MKHMFRGPTWTRDATGDGLISWDQLDDKPIRLALLIRCTLGSRVPSYQWCYQCGWPLRIRCRATATALRRQIAATRSSVQIITLDWRFALSEGMHSSSLHGDRESVGKLNGNSGNRVKRRGSNPVAFGFSASPHKLFSESHCSSTYFKKLEFHNFK